MSCREKISQQESNRQALHLRNGTSQLSPDSLGSAQTIGQVTLNITILKLLGNNLEFEGLTHLEALDCSSNFKGSLSNPSIKTKNWFMELCNVEVSTQRLYYYMKTTNMLRWHCTVHFNQFWWVITLLTLAFYFLLCIPSFLYNEKCYTRIMLPNICRG
jgi:hypothetical protein